jgi:hypothetical protein
MGRDEIAKHNSRILQEAAETRKGRPELWPLNTDELPFVRDEDGRPWLSPLFVVPASAVIIEPEIAATSQVERNLPAHKRNR